MSQDGSRLQNDSDEDVPLGSPEVLAANLLEAFAAADATSQGAAPAEWTIASFGGGADFAMSEDQAGAHAASPAQHAGTQVRLSELECDGDDDGSEAGSELSLLQPTPPRGHSADTMPPSEAVHTTPGAGSADSAADSTQRAGADFTFSTAPGSSHGRAYVSPVWGPLLRSAAPTAGAAAKPAFDAGFGVTVPAASQPVSDPGVAISSFSNAPWRLLATSEQLLARLAALEAPPAPAVVRQMRAAAEALRNEEAVATHVAMAQVLLDKKVPWLVRHTVPCLSGHSCDTLLHACVCNV